MKRILIIVLISFIFIILGGIAFLFLKGSAPKDQKVDPKILEKQQAEYVAFSTGDSYITNIKNSSKFLKVRVTLELRNEKSKAYFEKNQFKIKDIIIYVLRDKTEAELVQPDSQETLKVSIKQALVEKLSTKDLMDVYIDEFFIQ